MAALNLSQINLSNWAAGGENAIGFDVSFAYSADYKKNKHLWQNRLELAYGLNKTETDGSKKTNDKIYFSSTYGYELAKNLYFSSMVNFNSQFAKGYDYKAEPKELISRFMSPGYLMGGVGLTWNPKNILRLLFQHFPGEEHLLPAMNFPNREHTALHPESTCFQKWVVT